MVRYQLNGTTIANGATHFKLDDTTQSTDHGAALLVRTSFRDVAQHVADVLNAAEPAGPPPPAPIPVPVPPVPPPVTPIPVPPPPPLASPGLVHVANFVYQGAFRVPDILVPGKDRGFDYGGTAPAFNPANNSLFLVSHVYDQMTAELAIPSSLAGGLAGMSRASVIHPFVDAFSGHRKDIDPAHDPNTSVYTGGQFVHDGQLYLTAFLYYGTGQQVSHFVRSPNLNEATITGPRRVGPLGANFYAAYMCDVPPAWQSIFGPMLTGQCCLSEIARTSYGPAAFTFEWLTQAARPLVYYPADHPTLGQWNGPGASIYFNGTSEITGLIFVGDSVVFFGRHGLGTYCYGSGASCVDPESDPTSKGDHAYPYTYYVWAYDAHDLAAVHAGIKNPWDVKPYAVWPLALPTVPNHNGHHLGGAAYDPATGRLFLSQQFGDGDLPLIHVFTVTP